MKSPSSTLSEMASSDDGRSSSGSATANAVMEVQGEVRGQTQHSSGGEGVSLSSSNVIDDDDGLEDALAREKVIDDRLSELRAR